MVENIVRHLVSHHEGELIVRRRQFHHASCHSHEAPVRPRIQGPIRHYGHLSAAAGFADEMQGNRFSRPLHIHIDQTIREGFGKEEIEMFNAIVGSGSTDLLQRKSIHRKTIDCDDFVSALKSRQGGGAFRH